MIRSKHISALLFLLAGSTMLYAQDPKGKSGFDTLMRSNGRIYVVVAVLTCMLLGLLIYLIRLDRKMSKLEKE
jgi:hypothetical protein